MQRTKLGLVFGGALTMVIGCSSSDQADSQPDRDGKPMAKEELALDLSRFSSLDLATASGATIDQHQIYIYVQGGTRPECAKWSLHVGSASLALVSGLALEAKQGDMVTSAGHTTTMSVTTYGGADGALLTATKGDTLAIDGTLQFCNSTTLIPVHLSYAVKSTLDLKTIGADNANVADILVYIDGGERVAAPPAPAPSAPSSPSAPAPAPSAPSSPSAPAPAPSAPSSPSAPAPAPSAPSSPSAPAPAPSAPSAPSTPAPAPSAPSTPAPAPSAPGTSPTSPAAPSTPAPDPSTSDPAPGTGPSVSPSP